MKIGRWVVDCHIHCGKTDTQAPEGKKEHGLFAEVIPTDNSDWALFDMDAYGIDIGKTVTPLGFKVEFDQEGKMVPTWYGMVLLG